MARSRNNEFVNLSLTEFLMVAIFLLATLLFLAFDRIKGLEAEEHLTPEEFAHVEANATRFSEALLGETLDTRSGREKVLHFVEAMGEALDENAALGRDNLTLPEVWDTLETMQNKATALDERVQELSRALEKRSDGESVKQLVEEKMALQKELARLREQHDKFLKLAKAFSATDAKGLTAKINDLNGRYNNLFNRAAKQGVGNPLCWATPKGGIEYIFLIDIMENETFKVIPIYPDHRRHDFDAIGYVDTGKPKVMNAATFKKTMAMFWNWGQKNGTCRFFVKVRDRTRSKGSWKFGLDLVERYFYKQIIS